MTYNVTDANGNVAVEVTRTVNVLDRTVPVITLLGDATATIEVGSIYTDAGATATDNYDGDITLSIVTVNPVDATTVGVYTLTYNVTDANGNVAVEVTRTVNVLDRTVPVITLLGDATATIEVGSIYTDAGATATDNYDGDITLSIVTVNPVDATTVGVYTLTYNVTDANGNVAVEVTRTVNVLDRTVPVITLLGDATATIEVGSIYTDAGATATDNYDGDITLSIVTVNPVDATTVGVYTLTYNVTDANGNVAVEVTRTVNVLDRTVPVITLLGDATATIEVGSIYTDAGATATDNYDGDITLSIVTVNPVDATTVGVYTLTYNVTDANGNVAVEVTRTVNVLDRTVPVITLLGDATATIEVGSIYTDAGATATDNYDGDITLSIVTVNPVDATTVGVYTLTYNVTDANGNVAVEVTRTVNVLDRTVPVITLLGDATATIEVGSIYTDAGATATDNYDGDITLSIVTVNPVDATTVGVYTLTYNVTDANGNVAVEVTRTVNVLDRTVPVITLLGDATATIEVGSIYTDAGATATDNYDGDITLSIVTVNPVDATTVGVYTLTYNVTDANGNVAVEVTRTVNVLDRTVPVITLLGDATATIEVGSIYTDAGATATDNYDGDITLSIVTVNPVDATTVGVYTLTYNVTDANGNVAVEVTRTVNVLDRTVPVITLLGDATATIEVGSIYTDAGATATDNYDGDITLSIVTVNPVDATTVGVYTLTYNVTDANGNVAVEVTRTVNVLDRTVPVITLLGDATATIEVGSIYTDAGATATDNYDGDITLSIVTVNPVDATTVGVYTLTYNVTDANGNVAVEVTRTVNVLDRTVPVITLLGDATATIEVGSIYTDAGATATDNYDGDITLSIVTVNPVDATTVGVYTLTYNVTDANGNVAVEVTRTVNVLDRTVPVITLLGDATATIEVGSIYTDAGATATDNYDGDITLSIVTVNPVDATTVGVYTLTYNVTDANGNVAVEVTRTVNVLDRTVPVITLLGDATATIEVGSIYTDAGATATDNYDGDITLSIVTVNPVDATTVGVYTLTYNVTDANGNVAVEVTRTVNVLDRTVPVITLLGDATATIEVGSIYTDAGATATDNYDGDITLSIVTVNPVDATTVGVYTLTYNVTDANGNVAVEVTRTVNVLDRTVPVITLLGDATATIEVGSIYTDAGATATDNYDGDITLSIVTVNPVDATTVGVYTLTYNVTDANGNVAVEVTRTVNVLDRTVPVITLLGDATATIEVGSIYTDAGATATDNYDGDITLSIVTVNPVDATTVGVYTLTYNVTDANGNVAVEVTRTVNVLDRTVPVITLLGDATATIEVGSIYTDAGATATDNYDGDITLSIVTVNPVDATTVGVYTLTYNVTDANGNVAVEVTRTVNVLDRTVPVITLLGDATATIEVGSIYTDAGATATDNYDGDITLSIVTVNPVDATTVGVYTLTYNVTDANGNVAVEVTRTVNVLDRTVPVITLLGDATATIEVGSIYTDAGATASDNYDGDITLSIVTVNPVDATTVGVYTLTYNVTDANGNVAVEVTRTVNVLDTTVPVITLLGDATATIEVGSIYTDAGATATDNYDGDITLSIVTVNPVDATTVGVYTLTYNVTDANGNVAVEVTRTVNVLDTTVPVITLLGDATATIEVGSIYTDAGATATDNYDGDITLSIVTVNPVDATTVGVYTLTYNVTDANGNVAVEVTRTVNVLDRTVPVITLLGDATATIEVGSIYTDAGATATDNYDGDITLSIVTVNPVDATTIGVYQLTYDVTDSNSNIAETVTRIIDVIDTDIDGDGIGDTTDTDIDGDGIDNYADSDINGDGILDNGTDNDEDGINDVCRYG